ncbi:transglutaminase domain-containing protein [Pseudozobellia thermophila]|uniref:Transglutaminase-like enzyme, putative cysteine protease n=1 Tax=Pseudozobellia thermophila TaxID=192903 RepID=A0A1M6JJE1_9FLAO|nr:transglutaminase domain-containing protein [Pseudozobellia thermophila]SHJ46745.1 Transglutaminase-like enzyme, putative cysteine protease [Pseudozobellia thermophila]
MTRIKNILSVIPLFLIAVLQAQEVEFGEISKEELLEEKYELDPDAEAAVLYRSQNTYLQSSGGGARLITEVHERIKLYSKNGFGHATETIHLYKGKSARETVGKIKAFTYNLVNDKVVKSELDKDQIFENEYSYSYDQVKFTMPNVKEGSVIEFMYRINSPFIWNIDEFRFQRDIPIKRLEAELRTPEGFNFKQTHKGFIFFTPSTEKKMDNRLGMDVVVTRFDLKDIPALKAESYVDNIDNYRSGALFELVSVDIPGTVYKSYSQSWGDVAKTIGSSSDYKNELDKTRSFKNELDPLLQGKTNQLEILKLLFKYVKEQITWNGVDGKSFQNGIKTTLKEKKGNVADINLLLVAMLRYAGIKANPVILSTKDNAIPLFPTLDRLNYVIAHATINGKDYYMDATEEFSDVNLLPIRDYNWGGLLVDNPNKVWKHIGRIAPKKADNMHLLKVVVGADGTIEGSYQSRLTHHSAYQFRERYKEKEEDEFLNDLERKLSNIEISGYEVKNAAGYEGNVTESFTYEMENGADIINDKIYFYPLAFLRKEENPFKLEKREYPIDYGFPFQDRYMVEITLPEGYVVESLPKNIVMNLPDNLGKYKYVIRHMGNKIQLSTIFDINSEIISAVNYLDLKEYYNQVIIKGLEQVVLAKAANGRDTGSTGNK